MVESPDDFTLPRHRALDRLLRLTREILADEHVTDAEARRLREVVESDRDLLGLPAVESLVAHLRAVFADGYVTAKERGHLTLLLKDLAGDEEPETTD